MVTPKSLNSLLHKKKQGVADSGVDEDDDVSGLAMHDLQQGCS